MTVRLRLPTNADVHGIGELIGTTPALTPHRVDFPWRLALPAARSGDDARICEDATGVVVGFVAWQTVWAALDLYVRPGPWQEHVAERIFEWATEHFRELDRDRGGPLPYWVEADADDGERLTQLERQGYLLDDGYALVSLGCRLSDTTPTAQPPPGFDIRPLAGAEEIDAYVAVHRAAFQSESMTADWRRDTLVSPYRDSALDLVAVAPDGTLAGFCVGWPAIDGRCAQLEPVGVHPRYRGSGLARALLDESFRRLRERGIDEVLVTTDRERSPALRLYESAGFRATGTIVRRGRWVSSGGPGD